MFGLHWRMSRGLSVSHSHLEQTNSILHPNQTFLQITSPASNAPQLTCDILSRLENKPQKNPQTLVRNATTAAFTHSSLDDVLFSTRTGLLVAHLRSLRSRLLGCPFSAKSFSKYSVFGGVALSHLPHLGGQGVHSPFRRVPKRHVIREIES